jgi:O-antigen/teichoic acid export membrane protein
MVPIILRGAAEITGLVLGVISTLWVIRIVGPSYFGYYAVMLTIVTFGGLLINAGLPTAGSQRVANDPDATGEVLWVVTVSRAALAVVAVAGGLVILAVAPIAPVLRDYLRIGLVMWALIPLSDGWVLVSLGRLRAISGLRVASSAATLLAALALVRDVSDAGRVAWVPVAGAIVNAAGTSYLAQRWSPLRRPIDGSVGRTVWAYFRAGLHSLKADISAFIFTSSDRLFLYAFATPVAVGLYAAAYSIIQPFYMINVVVWDAMYLPVAQAIGTVRLGATFRRYVDLMSFATIPLGFFLLAFAPIVISTLYGPTYAPAGAYLAILGWVITFGYTSGIAVVPFSAWNRPREYGNATAVGGALNIGLNFALIPTYQAFGAAWATVAAKIAVTLAGIRYFHRATNYPLVRDFAEYLTVSAAAYTAAFVATHLLRYPTLVGIVIFGLIYVAMIVIVRWRHYGPPSGGTVRSLASRFPGVDEGSGS